MTAAQLLGPVLALAVVLATVRLVWASRRTPSAQRPGGLRTAAILVLQPLAAILLYLTLLPPASTVASGRLTVLTAGGAVPADADGAVIALPEATDLPASIERAPDLATALRRYPQAARLRIVGHGLGPRDRDATGARAVTFAPPALPAGVVELDAPDTAAPGAGIVVRGRLDGSAGATVALHDPAGRRVALATPDDTGAFALDGVVRGPGAVLFDIRVLDAEGDEQARVAVPVVVTEAPPLQVLLLAGAPNPDVRALRRWAEDAGMALRWQVTLGGGTQLGDAGRLDRALLDAQDLVVLDGRAWSDLGAAQRTLLQAAMRDGLGVLLHLPVAPAPALRTQLRDAGLDLGFAASRTWRPDGGPDDSAQLRARLGPGSDDAPFDPGLAQEAPPELAYLPMQGGGVAFTGPAPETMARWQAVGRGRLGVTTLADSHRLGLAGRGDLHAALWSGWAATLARPRRDDHGPAIDAWMRVGTRGVLCDVDADARVQAPDGAVVALMPDPVSGCAGFWPRIAGWHRLQRGDRVQPFHVAEADAAPSLHAAQLQAATRALVRDATGGPQATATTGRRGPSWPWAAGLLLALAALWSIERARFGLPARRPEA